MSNFQANFSNWWLRCFLQIALRWSLDLKDDTSTLVQVMAWCRQTTSHYLSQYWPRSISLHVVTRPRRILMCFHSRLEYPPKYGTIKSMLPVLYNSIFPWWRHQMETFSALLAICVGNSPVPGEFPTQRPATQSFDVFLDLRLNKRLSKQSWGWWFETL